MTGSAADAFVTRMKAKTDATNVDAFFYPSAPDQVYLSNLRVKKTAPEGTGSRFMNDMGSLADELGVTLLLSPGASDSDPVYKRTSSLDRLRRFYGRFGFKSSSKAGRYDLRGSMHRFPTQRG